METAEGQEAVNLVVYHVADDGTMEKMESTVDAENRTITFATTHFSTFVLANEAEADIITKTDAVNTGDYNSVFMWTAMIVLSAVVCVTVYRKKNVK